MSDKLNQTAQSEVKKSFRGITYADGCVIYGIITAMSASGIYILPVSWDFDRRHTTAASAEM